MNPNNPAIEIVIPVYNEEQQLAPNVTRLRAYLLETLPARFQITIADNASMDCTPLIAGQLAACYPEVRALRLEQKGRGRALRAASPNASAVTPPTAINGVRVPMQGRGASHATHRKMETALSYTPDEQHVRYLVDFGQDTSAGQVRALAGAGGVSDVKEVVASTDGGNGLEEALQRNLADHLTMILDWYHAAEHLCAFAKVWHARDEARCLQWQDEAKGILYEQGGEALLALAPTKTLPSALRSKQAYWVVSETALSSFVSGVNSRMLRSLRGSAGTLR